MQRNSTGVCAMNILLKQKSQQMDRGASGNLKIAWEVMNNLVQRPHAWARWSAGHLCAATSMGSVPWGA
jgi:hypothetical protein